MNSFNKEIDNIIENIPHPIKRILNLMETEEEKRMAVYATSTIAGALMPNAWINYDKKANYLGLMLLISYPPASGKGKLALLLNLVSKIVSEQRATNKQAKKEYTTQMRQFERAIKKGEKAELPEIPRTPTLLIPANTTSSKLTEQLYENSPEMMALIFETETDAITGMMNTKFGLDNSMIFRKAFHNESISLMRKTNNEHIDVRLPKMAIILTGTPSQIPKLFHSNQDGLISRFMIVTGGAPIFWKDVKPCEDCQPLDDEFIKLADYFYNLYHFYKSKSVEVRLTEYQWACLNSRGSIWLNESNNEGGENALSLAKRHANMLARLASILTLLRCFNSGQCPDVVYCLDTDFTTAEWLISQSFYNSLELFKNLPGEQLIGEEYLLEFYELLPFEFSTRELAPLEKTLQKSQRTIQRMLKRIVELKWVEQIKKGRYKKVDMADLSLLSE